MEDDDQYYNRRGVVDWPGESLKRLLALKYPGCETAVDAWRSLLKRKTPPTPERAAQPVQSTPAQKFTEVSAYIGNRMSGLDESSIPQERRDALAAMPLETVEQVRAWGIAWLEEIKKL